MTARPAAAQAPVCGVTHALLGPGSAGGVHAYMHNGHHFSLLAPTAPLSRFAAFCVSRRHAHRRALPRLPRAAELVVTFSVMGEAPRLVAKYKPAVPQVRRTMGAP